MKTVILLDTISAASDRTSGQFDLVDLLAYGVQVTFTGSDVVGTLKLQCSMDNITWIDITGSSQSITASSNHLWNVTASGYRYFRAVWTYTSGTGNITIIAGIKELITP